MDTPKIPLSVGIIMDGNRRYARERGLPAMEGHRLGYKKLKETVGWCRDAGIKYLTVYAFSTENWSRSPEEVSYLTELFNKALFGDIDELRQKNGAVRFIGQISRFGGDFEKQAQKIEAENPTNPDGTLAIALSYGGHAELAAAFEKIRAEKSDSPITEDLIEKHLWAADIPHPDIIIRTGGEHRLSGFLMWQSVYSELFFPKTYWPAFTKEEFLGILKEYENRDRRHGK